MNNKQNNLSLFAVSFAQGFISPNLPIASFKQGDKDLVFLLDSGSDNNVINEGALDYIEHEMYNAPDGNTHTLSGVNGTTEVKHCSIKFSSEEKSYKADFLVANMNEAFGMIKRHHCITIHGMLGSKFLRSHNIVLDFQNLSAYSKE